MQITEQEAAVLKRLLETCGRKAAKSNWWAELIAPLQDLKTRLSAEKRG